MFIEYTMYGCSWRYCVKKINYGQLQLVQQIRISINQLSQSHKLNNLRKFLVRKWNNADTQFGVIQIKFKCLFSVANKENSYELNNTAITLIIYYYFIVDVRVFVVRQQFAPATHDQKEMWHSLLVYTKRTPSLIWSGKCQEKKKIRYQQCPSVFRTRNRKPKENSDFCMRPSIFF